MISLRQALTEMRGKDRFGRFVPFDLVAVTCDHTHRTGGRVVEYMGVTLPQRDRVVLETNLKGGERNPRHLNNGTMNVMLPNGELRKVHTLLITKYNGNGVI